MTKFVSNLVASFLGYLVTIFLAYFLIGILRRVGVPFIGGPFPIWVEILLWLHSLVAVGLFLFLGTKLNLLGNHLLDFLSVCGILVVGFFLTFYGSYLGIFVGLAFYRLGPFLARITDNHYFALSILSMLPSVLIWLGMVYQSRKAYN